MLSPDAEGTSELTTPTSYRTADDGVQTLDVTTRIPHAFLLRSPFTSDRAVRETLAVLTQNDTGVSCWLCRDEHAIYRRLYLTLEQQLFMAYRNLERTAKLQTHEQDGC